jgi:hypothetical protein
MSLLRRIEGSRLPRPGETVEVYQLNRLLAAGTVVAADAQTITIAGVRGLIDLDTEEVRRGLRDGSIEVKRPRYG